MVGSRTSWVKRRYTIIFTTAIFAVVLVLQPLAFLMPVQQAEALTFGTPINLSNSADIGLPSVQDIAQKIVTSGNRIFVIWTSTHGSQDVGKRVFFTASSDNGVTFSTPLIISGDTNAPRELQMAVEGNNVYVTFVDSSDNTSNQPSVYLVTSNDGGMSFGAPIIIGSRISDTAHVAASGNDVFVTWSKFVGSFREIYLVKSSDSGMNFGTPINLSNSASMFSRFPQIALSGSNVYVGWIESPAVGAGINYEIYVASSTDGGTTFGSPVNVSNNSGQSSFNSFITARKQMIASGANIYVTWIDETPGNWDVLFARSGDAGASFSSPINLSDSPLEQNRPVMALSEGNIVLAWDGPAPGHTRSHVWTVTSTDSGNSFGAPVQITPSAGGSKSAPDIAKFGDHIYLSWQDSGLNAGAVRAAHSSNSGSSFGPPVIVGDRSASLSAGCNLCYPQIAASNAGAFVVWLFNGITNGDVYFNSAVTSSSPPVATPNGPYETDEGSHVSLDGSASSDPDGTVVLYEWDLDNDGNYDDATGPTPSVVFADNGLFTISLRVTDNSGLTATATTEVSVNNLPPVVGPIAAPLEPVLINSQISASASFTDAGILDTHTVIWNWGDGSASAGTVAESGGSGSVAGTHVYSSPGVYTVQLTVTDDDGGVGTQTFQYVVVYDPNGGFVTGGGWIDSPQGAYSADPSLTGKANFGFVSKYLKGSTTPTGNTEFQFKAGDLHFKSGDYEYLVIQVSNAKAQFMGTGTINGQGNYGFKLTAIDADVNTSDAHTADKFRIKMWDKDNGDEIVYDNQMGAADDADPTTVIGGGSIKIHKS